MASLRRHLVAAWVMVTMPRFKREFFSYEGIVEFMEDHELRGLREFRQYDFYHNCFADLYKDITGFRNKFIDPKVHDVKLMQAELDFAREWLGDETD